MMQSLSIARQAVAETCRHLALSFRRPALFAASRSVNPQRLTLAPQDLKTADPTAAPDIYAGRFFLAGKLIDCSGENPFTRRETPANWQAELHAFDWLRHLEADGTTLAKNNAVALITDWLETWGKPRSCIAWEADITARRLIGWICHSVTIVEAASPEFYHRWMRSIGTHITFLQRRSRLLNPGRERLLSRIALAYAGACLADQPRLLEKTSAALDRELRLQILEDGMHFTRNPAILLEMLTYLLPLRQAFERLGIEPPRQVILAVDRMMTALKFFRMGDGNLARFNGVSAGRPELISTLMFFDEAKGKPPESLLRSGYYRLELGKTIVICDAGSPPERALSETTHAGTLAFEMSSGKNLMVVNCGRPIPAQSDILPYSRATAAHSTATLNDTSSSRFYYGDRFRTLLGKRIISGRLKAWATRAATDDAKTLSAGHDGYLKPFGILHHRDLKLSQQGSLLEGCDRLTGAKAGPIKRKKPVRFAVRFHLHPSVSAGYSNDRQGLMLMCGSGDTWMFSCNEIQPILEESSFFASNSGVRRTRQIVIEGDARETPTLNWRFHQLPG